MSFLTFTLLMLSHPKGSELLHGAVSPGGLNHNKGVQALVSSVENSVPEQLNF